MGSITSITREPLSLDHAYFWGDQGRHLLRSFPEAGAGALWESCHTTGRGPGEVAWRRVTAFALLLPTGHSGRLGSQGSRLKGRRDRPFHLTGRDASLGDALDKEGHSWGSSGPADSRVHADISPPLWAALRQGGARPLCPGPTASGCPRSRSLRSPSAPLPPHQAGHAYVSLARALPPPLFSPRTRLS